ncbi:MAG: TetR/AcrR family transcriptional regulator [Bdellovibrionota bacterium]
MVFDRRKVVKTSIALFSRKGFMGTSLQEIADQCGATQSNLIYHYKSKANLFKETVGYIVQNNHDIVVRAMRKEDDARTRIEKHFKGNLSWCVAHKDEAQIVLLLYYFCTFDPVFSEVYQKILKAAINRLEEYILAGQREGLFSNDIDTRIAASILQDSLMGALVNVVAHPNPAEASKSLNQKWKVLFQTVLG